MDAQCSLVGRKGLRATLIALVTVFAVFVAAAFGGNVVPTANATEDGHVHGESEQAKTAESEAEERAEQHESERAHTDGEPGEFHIKKEIEDSNLAHEDKPDAETQLKDATFEVTLEFEFPEGQTAPAKLGLDGNNTKTVDLSVGTDSYPDERGLAFSDIPAGTKVTLSETGKPELDGFHFDEEKFIAEQVSPGDQRVLKDEGKTVTIEFEGDDCFEVTLTNPIRKTVPGEFHIKKQIDYSKLTDEDAAKAKELAKGKQFPVNMTFEFPEGTNREAVLEGKEFELVGENKAQVKLNVDADLESYAAVGGDERGIAFSHLPIGTKVTFSEGEKPNLGGFGYGEEVFIVKEGHPHIKDKPVKDKGKTVTIQIKGNDCFEIALSNPITSGATPGTDTPGTDTPGTDTPGTDTPGTDTPGTDTPGTDTPEEPGSSDDKKNLWWLLLLVPVIPGLIWLFNQGPGTSSTPTPGKPDDNPQPGKPGDNPQPGKPGDNPKPETPREGDKPQQARPGTPEQPVKPGAPSDGRQPIQSVPSGATEKGNGVADFIG
ncbi:hypothetical protein KBX10_11010 [Corynebacterium sp. CCUG 59401]|nr:hypothetical protein [Corynebacterium pseudogenitalium]